MKAEKTTKLGGLSQDGGLFYCSRSASLVGFTVTHVMVPEGKPHIKREYFELALATDWADMNQYTFSGANFAGMFEINPRRWSKLLTGKNV